jgi:hypothetical protein
VAATTGTRARGAAVLALATGLLVAGGPPGSAQPEPTPTVTVTPATDLVDFQLVQVTGSGFEPGTWVEYYECRGGAVSEADCDASNAFEADVDGAGDVEVTFAVDARIYLPDGTEVDCRTDPAGCELGVGYILDADEWPAAALHFDPDAPLRPPVAATAAPTAGLRDGDVVAVHGDNLSHREEAFAYLCAAGDTDVGARCDLDRLARGVPDQDGSIDLDLEVHRRFAPPQGGTVDCAAAPGGCEILVSWGFYGWPDRRATVPVSFAAAPPGPTTSTTGATTATVPPGPAAPPTAAPAAPVPARPRFTG